jgi:hypothetical protein
MSNYVLFDDDLLSDLEKKFGLLHPEDSNDEWDDLDLDLEGFCLVAAFCLEKDRVIGHTHAHGFLITAPQAPTTHQQIPLH